MEHTKHGMERKWRRHFREAPTVIALSLMFFGVVFIIPTVVLWPQYLSSLSFDSRLLYETMIDVEDYWTCDAQFKSFAIDEPAKDDAMYTMYLFEVSNTRSIIQSGVKPELVEKGPFGYTKHTYKYDIWFDPISSENVTFKEYTLLQPIPDTDLDACARMYLRMERTDVNVHLTNVCADHVCDCVSHNEAVTIFNPLFLKLMWEESSEEILSRFSSEVFINIKYLLGDQFVNAVKSYLVSFAYAEICQFRLLVQTAPVLETAVSNLLVSNSLLEVANMIEANNCASLEPSTCGLSSYGISSCPMCAVSYLKNSYFKRSSKYNSVAFADLPSVIVLLNSSDEFSYLNYSVGMPRWVGVCSYIKQIPFIGSGMTTLTDDEFEELFFDLAYNISVAYAVYTGRSAGDVTDYNVLAAQVLMFGMCSYLYLAWMHEFETAFQKLNTNEFRLTSDPVPCSPALKSCVWQWGYITANGISTYAMSSTVADSLVWVRTAVFTNPASLLYSTNSHQYYNTYKYCNNPGYTYCDDLDYAIPDATLHTPAYLWGVDVGFSLLDRDTLYTTYAVVNQSPASRALWNDRACALSYLQYTVYTTMSDFHDDYVIRYLNKNKDSDFNYTFTSETWDDFKYVQFAGGYVTQAVVGVRNIYQVSYDGMWRYGDAAYFSNFIEYSSWAVYVGYPQAILRNVTQAKILLDSLADLSEDGVRFRRHIVRTGTTYVGDDVTEKNLIVFYKNETTYITESNLANFSCPDDPSELNREACEVLNVFYTSSYEHCQEVEDLYVYCVDLIYNANQWVDHCDSFETSMSSPTFGIQCDAFTVYGRSHPYTKSVGNVVFEMMFSLNNVLVLQEGLWCEPGSSCDFTWGGLFVTSSAKNIFFEGFTEPSVLKYLDRKYAQYNISFTCATSPIGTCGVKLYNCSVEDGVIIGLPSADPNSPVTKLLLYDSTPKDEYFAPHFLVNTENGQMYWPYAQDSSVALADTVALLNLGVDVYGNLLDSSTVSPVVKVINPMYAFYPAWHTSDVDFNKYYQCQKRIFGGPPNLFANCEDVLNTGRSSTSEIFNILQFHGNNTLHLYESFDAGIDVSGSSSVLPLIHPYLWEGFHSFPYSYQSETSGADFHSMANPVLFHKQHSTKLKLSQTRLFFAWERDLYVTVPLLDVRYRANETSHSEFVNVRRFCEDEFTWEELTVGKSFDYFGMSYNIPYGLSSMEGVAGVPMFMGTAHFFGNYAWGGLEYGEVIGLESTDSYGKRTFIDYDPVTGRSVRTAIRQQVHFRVERGSMFPNIISFQGRCVVPNKNFLGGGGYGCYGFYPILWFEDARVIQPDTFFSDNIRFYTRPERAASVYNLGIVVGGVCFAAGLLVYIHELYYKKKFNARIYIE